MMDSFEAYVEERTDELAEEKQAIVALTQQMNAMQQDTTEKIAIWQERAEKTLQELSDKQQQFIQELPRLSAEPANDQELKIDSVIEKTEEVLFEPRATENREEIDQGLNKSQKIALLHRRGFSTPAIAQELGLSKNEVHLALEMLTSNENPTN